MESRRLAALAMTRPQINLAPCSRILLEKLTLIHLVEKFGEFYETQRFNTLFTRAVRSSYPESNKSSIHRHTLQRYFGGTYPLPVVEE
jgi:hypothetical protein